MAVPAAAKPHPDPRGIVYTLGTIALAVALVGVALAYAIDAAGRSARTAPHRWDTSTTLSRTIGGKTLTIPLAWFRNPEAGGDENFSRQVELSLRLPLGSDGAMLEVGIMLVPRSTVRASARLLDGVYLHLFEDTEVAGPPGLIGKPLKSTGGYASETVWYDPLSADPFVAKCAEPVDSATAGDCLRIVYLAPALAAVYRFPVDVLEAWRTFDSVLAAPLKQIGALGT